MSNAETYDAIFRVVRGENRAIALRVTERETDRPLFRSDIRRVTYSIAKRGLQSTIQLGPPTSTPIVGHTNVEIPVAECIRDNPPVDPIDGVAYNFLYIIPTVDENDNDISPFTEVGTTYDVSVRFFPYIGGRKFTSVRTVRVECI